MRIIRPRLFAVAILSTSFVGCAALPDEPNLSARAEQTLGSRHAIALQMDEQPIDAPMPDTHALSLRDALARGLEHSSQLQAALARIRRAHAEAHQARLLPNPIVTIALRFPESKGDPIIEAGLAANLMAALQAPWQASAADQRLRVAAEEALTVLLDVSTQLQQRYLDAQACEAMLPILQGRRQLAVKLLDLSRTRLKNGEGTRLDVDTAEGELIELDVEVAERELARVQSRIQLARQIGRPGDAATWKLDEWSGEPAPLANEHAWIAAAMEHRPEIQAKRWELAALGVEDRLTRLALLDGIEPGVAAERDGEWSLGPALALPLPIFDWGQAKRDAVRARQLETMHELTRIRRDIVEEVRLALASHASQHATLDRISRSLLPLLERRRNDAESALRGGHSDVIPVLLADRDLQAAHSKRIELQQKIRDAAIRLHRAVGGAAFVPSADATAAATPSIQPLNQPSTQPASLTR